jgi:hypothetical protein
MSFHFSPQISKDGLVLYLDAANPFAFDGENLALNSEALNLWSNNGAGILRTPNVEIAPNGTLTADTLAQTTVTGVSRWISSINNRTYTAGVTYTLSIWLKKVSGNDPQPNIWLWVNGAYVLGGGNTVGPITNQWVRYTRTFTPATTISVNTFSGLAVGWNVNGVANDYVFAAWGFQIETGSSARTYFPTTSSPKLMSVWKDLSRGGNNGSLTNGPLFNSLNSGSLQFDGTDDYVQVPSPFGDIDWSTRAWSISAWMKLDAQGNRCLVNLNSSTASNYVLTNVWTNNRSYWYFIKNSVPAVWGVTNFSFNQTTGNFSINEIFHFTMTYNGNGITSNNILFYKNGVQLVTEVGGSASVANQAGLQIGGTNYPLDGNVYNFMMFNRVLSPIEILQNYNATKSRFGL